MSECPVHRCDPCYEGCRHAKRLANGFDSWQEEAIAALAFLAPAEEWRIIDGDLFLTEDGEAPDWLISLDGLRMRMDRGWIAIEGDVQQGDYALTARWLLDAAAAWGVEEREVARGISADTEGLDELTSSLALFDPEGEVRESLFPTELTNGE